MSTLQKLDLNRVLKRKNPYLFRAKNMLTSDEIIESMLDALLSSSEEKMFGDFFEHLAIFVSTQLTGGVKSSAAGIDLEFERGNVRYLVAIKSGPNWGNSSQYSALENYFKKAKQILSQNHNQMFVQPVLGICYGSTKTVDRGLYTKITGQSFWHFISDDEHFYQRIVEPIGYQARLHNERFHEARAALKNRLSARFTHEFCHETGEINWPLLIEFNSGNLFR